jgi:hypothetical protein
MLRIKVILPLLLALFIGFSPLALAQSSVTNFDNVTVSGDVVVGDDVTTGGNLSVAGAIVASDFITTSGDVDFPANLVVSDTLTAATITSTANTNVGANLKVVGTSDLQGNLSDSGGALTDNVLIDGQADAVQLTVQGNATQTSLPFVVENSAGVDQFTVSNTGTAATTDDLTVGDDATVTGLLLKKSATQAVTNGGTITPTSSVMLLTSAGTVTPTLLVTGTAGTEVTLIQTSAQNIVVTEAGNRVMAGNDTLGQYDNITFWSDGTRWIETGRVNN